jgi:hypothetical protein
MDDATYEAQKARLAALYARWIPLLRLDRTEIAIDYRRDQIDAPSKETLMSTRASWRYHCATIDVYVNRYAERSDAWAEEDVVHELAHVLLGAMHELFDYDGKGPSGAIAEHVCQEITLAILNVHRAGAA